MKTYILPITCLAVAAVFSSCNDYLDSEPITSVTTDTYLYAENDLATYANYFYNDSIGILLSHRSGQYSLGVFKEDNGTDNQTADTPSKLFVPGQSHVGDWDQWSKSFRRIRDTNYFLQTVLPRYENSEISGADANIRHYIGEVYFFRAAVYFDALKNLGDFPIIEDVLSDDYQSVREASKRRPRNEVARFIISDLDKAYDMMLQSAPNSNRLNRDCAALLKSRVALYEGTWEKYHKGTSRVPGGPGWPGASVEYLSDFTIDIVSEIDFFLSEAVKAADIVASAHQLASDYASLFNSVSLSGNPEVLLWRQYSTASDASSYHFVVSYLQRDGGGNSGFTRSMVDSYLMSSGMPVYADNSYLGDDTYEHLFKGRDPRMGMTILKPGDKLSDSPTFSVYTKSSDGCSYFYRPMLFEGQVENSNPTGYSLRKGLNTSGDMATTKESYTACPVFRAAEAYLNYIEAYYELNGRLGDNCGKYWEALRERARMDTDYSKTIGATDMTKEMLDWGSFSAGTQVDATLYNIRRERRVELAAEGFRMADLKRWRSLDQIKDLHLQGFNMWDCNYKLYTEPSADDAVASITPVELREYGHTEETPNISAHDDLYAEGRYLLPYRKNKANIGFNGLSWNQTLYLFPIRNKEFRLTTATEGSDDYTTSSIYQNPGWSINDGSLPED